MLGGFEVAYGGRAVVSSGWPLRRAAVLVKLLALAPGRQLHREQLAATLWPASATADAAVNLRQHLHVARSVVGDLTSTRGVFLQRQGELLMLGPPEQIWIDVEAFEAALSDAWRGQDAERYDDALALYAGDLLPEDLYEEWAADQRTALRASYVTALSRLAGLRERHGDLDGAMLVLQRALAAEPAQEEAHVALMRVYAQAGQRRRALAQYELLSRVLRRDLDVEPDGASTRLYEVIRAGRFPATSAASEQPVVLPRGTRPLRAWLPAPLTDILGRERELAELERLLLAHRLVTLTGPGGIGKTRLAIATARALCECFHGSATFVDLAAVRDPELVFSSLADALGVIEADTGSLRERVAGALGERVWLLVLDNFEHLTAAAPAIAELLTACPGVTALITSRAPLRVRGEQLYAVRPLMAPDAGADVGAGDAQCYAAVALFIERAREALPAFQMTDASAADVIEICRRLDGLPLAIELAAAQVRAAPIRTVLERLGQCLPLLTGGARDLPARQRTLRDTIAWSYELLSDDERRLFRWLSVFSGGWTVDAARAVTGTADALPVLVEHSLVREDVRPDGARRYGLLETIREYGQERLREHGEAATAAGRHVAWMLAFAREADAAMSGPLDAVWLPRYEEEQDNARAALSWAVEHDAEAALCLAATLTQFWNMRSRYTEGRRWLESALAESASGSPRVRAQALDGLGTLEAWQGDYSLAQAHHTASLALYRAAGDRIGIANALCSLGRVARFRGDAPTARRFLTESLELCYAPDYLYGASLAHGCLGIVDCTPVTTTRLLLPTPTRSRLRGSWSRKGWWLPGWPDWRM